MKKLDSIIEAIDYLKEGDIVTSDGKDQFVLRKDRIYRYFDGSVFPLSLEDFIDLYRKTVFFLYEEEAIVDDGKDEVYYRFYRK